MVTSACINATGRGVSIGAIKNNIEVNRYRRFYHNMVEGGGQSEGLITTSIDPIHSEEVKRDGALNSLS